MNFVFGQKAVKFEVFLCISHFLELPGGRKINKEKHRRKEKVLRILKDFV